jgi:hypothetical protein
MNSILMELYCIPEAPLYVLKGELLFVIEDVNFSRKQ